MRCDRCEKRGSVLDYEGNWRCVHCNPKKFIWDKKKLIYIEDKWKKFLRKRNMRIKHGEGRMFMSLLPPKNED